MVGTRILFWRVYFGLILSRQKFETIPTVHRPNTKKALTDDRRDGSVLLLVGTGRTQFWFHHTFNSIVL